MGISGPISFLGGMFRGMGLTTKVRYSPTGGGCSPPGWCSSLGVGAHYTGVGTHRPGILQDTVDKRVVHIQLEYFLVLKYGNNYKFIDYVFITGHI